MKKFITIIILLELVVASGIIYNLVSKFKSQPNLDQINLSPVNKNNLYFPENPDFEHYYELKPSTTITRTRDWDTTTTTETINSDGLNERFEYSVTKPANTFRIITLGDSFTYGLFVNTKDNWSEELEDSLNSSKICGNYDKMEVINLGMHGFDVPYLTKRFADLGTKYNPDLIIWFESGTGFTRYLEKMWPHIETCENAHKETDEQFKSEYYSCWLEAKDKVLSELTPEGLVRELSVWMDKFLKNRQNTPVLFGTFINTTDEDKKQVKRLAQNNSDVYIMESISNIAIKNGIFPDWHPNEEGHKIIANDIFKFLETNKSQILKCSYEN